MVRKTKYVPLDISTPSSTTPDRYWSRAMAPPQGLRGQNRGPSVSKSDRDVPRTPPKSDGSALGDTMGVADALDGLTLARSSGDAHLTGITEGQ